MAKLYFRKMPGGTLVPDDDDTAEWLQKVKNGAPVSGEFTKPRNYRFLKKYMALINLAFDAWEPEVKYYKGQPTQKNKTRFRKDIAIASGFYELTVNLRGEVRTEARSISFAHMSEEEFNQLYQSTITLLLDKYRVFTHYRDGAEVERVVNDILRFA
jgi:uncharacterized membrane protein YukC